MTKAAATTRRVGTAKRPPRAAARTRPRGAHHAGPVVGLGAAAGGRDACQDRSIGVPAFVRDPDACQVLERVVIPALVQRSGRAGDAERPVRVWVSGCGTGEDAYAIAILFLEQFALAKQRVPLQIFATDVDAASLEVARAGVYPDRIAADVSPERLGRFFVKADAHHYQVRPDLRAVITWAPQPLTRAAPWATLDLIVCRPGLLDLEPAGQAHRLARFHGALVEGGYLLLGPAASIGSARDRFAPIAKTGRVYRRISPGARGRAEIPIRPAPARGGPVAHRDVRPRPAAGAALLHRALLADFAPAAVLIDLRDEILSVEGPVVDYLAFPPGALTRHVLAMARPGLRLAIRRACQRARHEHRTVIEATARVKRQRTYVACTVTARPVGGPPAAEGLLLVTFQDRRARRPEGATPPAHPAAPRRGDEAPRLRQLAHELQATRDDLQATIDELQTAHEALHASHDDVLSMQAALQTTHAERETAQAAQQARTEALQTVNRQLQDQVHALDTAHTDLGHLLASTDIAAVWLDADLRLTRFTPLPATLLHLLPTDLGRPWRDIAPPLTDRSLLEDCRRVLETRTPVDTVVRAEAAPVYLRRVLPSRPAARRRRGVVITWVDITQRHAAEAAARRLSAVLADSPDAVVLLDLEGRITGWNRGAARLYGYTEAEACTLQIQDLVPEGARAGAGDRLRRIGRGEGDSESGDTLRMTQDGRTREVSLTMTLLRDAAGQPDAIVTIERDVTDLKAALAAQQAAQIYHLAIEHLPAGAVLREDGRLTMNLAAEAMTGYLRSELPTVDAWCAALHGDRARALRPCYELSGAPGRLAPPVPLAITRKDGHLRHLELTVRRLDPTHELWRLLDMTERDQAERALRRSEDYLRSIVTTAVDAIVTIDAHGIIDTFNPAAEQMFGYPAAEAIGQNVRLLMPPPYREAHDGYLARYLTTGEARLIGIGRELTGLRKDGTTFPLELTVSEIAHIGHFTGVLRDLSDRRQLEWRLAESQLEERRHMARELHDDLGGHMTGLGLLAQTLQTELERAQSPLAARTQALVRSISDAHQHLRAVIRGLMPVDTIPEGLMAALNTLATQCETVSRIPCRFQCEPPVHVEDPGTALQLFRIAQEAVNNAVRHGQPAQITLSLGQRAQRLEIVVTDDGRGLGEIPPGHPGIGLASMRQRARLLGGECAMQPRDGGGTVVRCWVPLPDRLARHTGRRPAPPSTGVRG